MSCDLVQSWHLSLPLQYNLQQIISAHNQRTSAHKCLQNCLELKSKLNYSPKQFSFHFVRCYQRCFFVPLCWCTGPVLLPTHEVPFFLLVGCFRGKLGGVCRILFIHRAVSWTWVQELYCEFSVLTWNICWPIW